MKSRGIPNKLRAVRTIEGIKRSTLAKTSDLADRTIARVEEGHSSTPVTLHRLLNALNKLRTRREIDYSFKEVFPQHLEKPRKRKVQRK